MSYEECWRILGVPADTNTARVRQAYLDLARVWHPDRFQSDDRLRKIAEDHLRKINEAYAVLKNYRPPETRQDSARAQASADPRSACSGASGTKAENPPPAQSDSGRPPQWRPPSVRRPASLAIRSWCISNKVAYTAMMTVLFAAPFFAVSQLVGLLYIPSLDTNPILSAALQPKILSPMRIIDPNSDVLGAADALTTWVRGDALDLWKPAQYISPAPAAAVARTGGAHRKPRGAPRQGHLKPSVAIKAAQAPPQNGTDLISDGRQGGAGELRLSNRSGLAAVFKLVSERRTRRAVYVASNGKVTLRSIPVGTYDLHVDLGSDLDVEHLHFMSGSVTPTPLGPFQFLQVTSETGTSGNHYSVVLNSQ